MFKLFRRKETPPPKPPAKPASRAAPRTTRSRPAPLTQEPPPLPDVHEDHDESAWDLWEQSQFQLDSQMGELPASSSVRVKDAGPSQAGDLDPFARIGKNHR